MKHALDAPLVAVPGPVAHLTGDAQVELSGAHTAAHVAPRGDQLDEVLRTLPRTLRDLASVLEKLGQIRAVQLDASRDMEHMCGTLPAPPVQPIHPRMFTVKSLAEYLDVDPKTVRRWKGNGLLPEPLTVGGVVRWSPQAIEDWIQTGAAK